MKTAENLLALLGIKHYTKRHIELINDFLKNKNTATELLDQLGDWDDNDLKIVEEFLKHE